MALCNEGILFLSARATQRASSLLFPALLECSQDHCIAICIGGREKKRAHILTLLAALFRWA